MKKLIAFLKKLFGWKPKTPPPPPPPPQVDRLYPEMLLKVGGDRFLHQDGSPFRHMGVQQCCFSEDSEPNPGWPMATNAWIDYAASKGATLLHFRTAPWRIESDDTGTAFRDIGAAYLEVGGKADLAQWNQRFWDHVKGLVERAASKGLWVQVCLIDDWATKWGKHGGYPGRPNWEYHPWMAQNNVQGQDWCARANTGAIVMGSGEWGVYEALIRKTVFELGRFGNVIWLIGNETNLVPGYSPAWDPSVAEVVRDEERRRAYLKHPIGTQTEDASVIYNPLIDYSEWHTHGEPANKLNGRGKPISVNEYNPNPSMSPEQLYSSYCSAQESGSYFWYWRHGQYREVMNKTLDLLRGGCAGVSGCKVPADWQQWVVGGKPAPSKINEVAAGVAKSRAESGLWTPDGFVKGEKVAATFWAALDDIAFRMRQVGVCAFWSDDAVLVRRGDGMYEEYGLIAWGTGGLRPPSNPNVYRGCWKSPR